MKGLFGIREAEPRKTLEAVVGQKLPAIMSYLSRGKWHVAKVTISELGATRLSMQLWPREKPGPMNIQIDQPVGISVKYGYCKLIFDSVVKGFEPSSDPTKGGTIMVSIPTLIEMVERRSYFRVIVPQSMKVNVTMWHRNQNSLRQIPENYSLGRLIDISAGGLQVAIEVDQNPDFKKGQFVGMRFTPLPYEQPILFNAQIRTLLPTTDEKTLCFGMQIVGLESSAEGRKTLRRLCNVVEQYYKMNQGSAKTLPVQMSV